jgi:16S rRNA (guanine527-N7)-methyltransferase
MIEEEVQGWLVDHDVSRETIASLERFATFLLLEAESQNLIAASTKPHIWSRHILDSAQLLGFAPDPQHWLDIGTGAGFPGLVIAAISECEVTLVEQRPLRADFLRCGTEVLGIAHRCHVICSRVEQLPVSAFDVISARAFAPLPQIFAAAARFSTLSTRWILPKGRNAQTELAAAESSWQGDFRLEPSLTDADARIIVAQGVRRKREGKRRG